mmetsp:Transcript_37560/g.118538  ORF Transcript_37560/g.118538 Transcript_37560/m.118538 type:complete len:329 (-) Transcript_37560:1699-2685(-)
MMKISKERLVQLVLYKSRSAVKFSRVMLEIARSYIAELRGTNVMDLRCLLRVHERTATVHHLDSLRDATAVEVLMRWVETMRGRLKGSHAAQKLSERLESFGVETMVESGLLAELIEHSSKSHKETIQQKLLVSLLSSSSRSQVMQQVMRTGREVNKSHRKCEELVDKLARNGFTSSHRFTVSQLADPEDDAGRLAVTAVLFLVHPSLEVPCTPSLSSLSSPAVRQGNVDGRRAARNVLPLLKRAGKLEHQRERGRDRQGSRGRGGKRSKRCEGGGRKGRNDDVVTHFQSVRPSSASSSSCDRSTSRWFGRCSSSRLCERRWRSCWSN